MLSDEAVLALSSVVGDLVKDQLYGLQILSIAVIALVTGSRTAIYHSVLVAYVVRQILELPLNNLALGVVLLLVATRAQPHFQSINVVTVVAYTVADVVANTLLEMTRPMGATFVVLVATALTAYVLNTRDDGPGLLVSRLGVAGLAIFRISKFVLVHEGVRQLLSMSAGLVYHPILWVGVGLLLLYLTHTFYKLPPNQLVVTDAVLHAAASSVAASTIGLPTRITTMELMVTISVIYLILSTYPPSPVRDLLKSVTLFIAILNLRALGIFPILLLLLAETSTPTATKSSPGSERCVSH